MMRDAVPGPLLDDFWPRAVARRREVSSPGLRFALARREIEASWGTSNLELPLSAVCQTDGFLWFVCHLLARLPDYLQIHNDALAEYRLAHGIRSKNHPVSALAVQGDWLEAPFWVWRRENPRRRGLLARLRNREIDLRIAGEDEVLVDASPRPRSRGVLRRRTAARSASPVRTAPHPGTDDDPFQPFSAWRSVHPRNRRLQVRRARRRDRPSLLRDRAARLSDGLAHALARHTARSRQRPTWPNSIACCAAYAQSRSPFARTVSG